MTTAIITNNTSGGTYSGTDDTYCKENDATASHEADATYEVHSWASGDRANLLIRFTGLSNITGPVTVSSATISLYRTDTSDVDRTLDVHRCSRAWVEAQETWNVYSTGNNWATAGGTGTGDIVATASASVGSGFSHNVYVDFTSAQLAADVQDMINNGGNNGWLFKRNDYTAFDATTAGFSPSEGTDGQRPKLTVVYTATGSSVALGGSASTPGSGTGSPGTAVTL